MNLDVSSSSIGGFELMDSRASGGFLHGHHGGGKMKRQTVNPYVLNRPYLKPPHLQQLIMGTSSACNSVDAFQGAPLQYKFESKRQRPNKRLCESSCETLSEPHGDAGDYKLPQFDVHKDTSSFYMQSVRFYSDMHLTKNDEEVRKKVLADVYDIFEKALPNLRVLAFGSVHTGLATRTSDLDIYLESSVNPYREFIRNNGFLVRRSTNFKDVLVIGQARVPIIRATHVTTGIQVDINATSKHSLLTSAIIKFLMSGNSRAKRLTMLVIHWAKMNRLIGQNLFTSYLFCILIIFYLQQLNPPILPAVSRILESGNWANQHPYWVKLDPKLLDSQSMIESHTMFQGFFEYYSNFDFEKNIISCYLGKPIPVNNRNCPYNLSEEIKDLISYPKDAFEFPIGEINIQDLCQLHVNKTDRLVPRFVRAFKMSLTRVVETLSGLPDSKWLQVIFSQPPVEVPNNPKKKIISRSFELTYTFLEGDWFAALRRDLEATLNILQVKWSAVSTDSTSFSLKIKCEYSVFGKKFKRIVPALLAGEMTVQEFPLKVKMIIERIAKPDTRLEADLLVVIIEKGRVLLTFTEMCEILTSSIFGSYVASLQTYLENLLAVCHLP